MEFIIEKCARLIIRSKKRRIAERIELPNQERIRTPGENRLKDHFDIPHLLRCWHNGMFTYFLK